MNYISVDNVIAFAKTLTKDKSTASMNIWREWVFECIKGLGWSDEEIKACALYPENLTAKLPPNCQQIVEIALFDSSNRQLAHQFRAGKYRIYQDSRLLPAANAGQPTNSTTVNNLVPVDVSSDAYHLHLGTNGSQVATILIRYFSLPIDDKTGELMVNLDDRQCAAYYILFMEALRADDNQSKIQLAEQRFYKEADRCRARRKMESMTYEKAKTLKGDLMNMLPLNNLSKF